jgi:hypothetical protein
LGVVGIDPSAAFGAFVGIGLAVAFEGIGVVAGIAPSVAGAMTARWEVSMAAGARAGIGKVVFGSFWIRGGIGSQLNNLNGRERWNTTLWYLISQKSQVDDINTSALLTLPP